VSIVIPGLEPREVRDDVAPAALLDSGHERLDGRDHGHATLVERRRHVGEGHLDEVERGDVDALALEAPPGS
jgi:hypothetical protein